MKRDVKLTHHSNNMQETIIFSISDELAKACSYSAEDKEIFLIEEIKKYEASIMRMLSSYHYESRGEVSEFDIDGNAIRFDDQCSGIFKVTYQLNYFLACSDKSYQSKDKMEIHFSIDLANNTM